MDQQCCLCISHTDTPEVRKLVLIRFNAYQIDRHYEHITSEELVTVDKTKVPCLEELLELCLTHFMTSALANRRRHQDLLGPAGLRSPVDAIYKSELYRTLYEVLGASYAQSEWCGPGRNQERIDFRVIVPRPNNEPTEYYGIQCSRDGDRLRHHAARLVKEGKQEGVYYQWTQDGSLTQIALLNFTTSDVWRQDGL